MSFQPYRFIVLLLGICLLFILTLQGLWIKNFYASSRAELDKTIYAALENVSQNYQDRQNLRTIRRTIKNSDSVFLDQPQKLKKNKFRHPGKINKARKRLRRQRALQHRQREIKIEIIDTQVVDYQRLSADVSNQKHIRELITRVENEISETERASNTTSDTSRLRRLLERELKNKGLTSTFHFALAETDDGLDTIRSAGFNFNEEYFQSDLSIKRLFKKPVFLLLQMNDLNEVLFERMQRILILTGFFALLIISLFIYIASLIFKQKRYAELKNDFMNNITHELKTPIATMRLAAEAIKKSEIKNDPEKYKNYTRIIEEENEKLNNHVDRILEMSQLQKGEKEYTFIKTDIVALIKKTIEHFQLQINQKNARVIFNTEKQEIFIAADLQNLQAAFNSLLDNSLKYCNKEPLVEFNITEDKKTTTISIKDNGIGINASEYDRIFDKFYRVSEGNLHTVKGTGLGLSFVKQTIKAHGGSITVKSEAGKGSIFTIKLKKNVD